MMERSPENKEQPNSSELRPKKEPAQETIRALGRTALDATQKTMPRSPLGVFVRSLLAGHPPFAEVDEVERWPRTMRNGECDVPGSSAR